MWVYTRVRGRRGRRRRRRYDPQAAAQLENSKAWMKEFFARHGLPTARYKTFSDFEVSCGGMCLLSAHAYHARRMMVICSPLSGFWHCGARTAEQNAILPILITKICFFCGERACV